MRMAVQVAMYSHSSQCTHSSRCTPTDLNVVHAMLVRNSQHERARKHAVAGYISKSTNANGTNPPRNAAAQANCEFLYCDTDVSADVYVSGNVYVNAKRFA